MKNDDELPPGRYELRMTDVERRPSDDLESFVTEATLVVVDGEHAGATIRQTLHRERNPFAPDPNGLITVH
jgi:hypothetical protein